MAYIIAHGTVNGYRKLTQAPPVGLEQNVLADIRMEFDTTQTMLQKPAGYILQMAPNGAWVSIVRLLFDGERSGNGAGFFAFSAFIPNDIIISGEVIKTILDDLMNTYRGIIAGDLTKNIGVDWSFVEQASQRLNAQCKQRKKIALTNYMPSEKFAYVEISSPAALPLYLEKPFQPEYGGYKAVFMGTTLQNPNRISTYTKLDIDFENEQYEIVWKGDKQLFSNLPRFVREKDIPMASYIFKKPYYKDVTVYFKDGNQDDANCVIEMVIPKLQAQEYNIPVNYLSNDGADEKMVTALVVKSVNVSKTLALPQEQKNSIVFRGEEIQNCWRITAKTIDGYASSEISIIPEKQPVATITLYKVKTISVQIRRDGELDTNKSRDKIQFINRQTKTIVSASSLYSREKDCLLFSIRENSDFLSLYEVQCLNVNYIPRIESIEGVPNAFVIDLTKRVYPPIDGQTKLLNKIKILVPKDLYESSRPFNVYLGNKFIPHKEINCIVDPCELEIEHSGHIKDFTLQSDGSTLKNIEYDEVNRRIIVLPPESFIGVVANWLKRNYKILLSAIAGVLILAGMVIAALQGFGVIDARKWFPKDKGVTHGDSVSVVVPGDTTSLIDCTDFEEDPYLELERTYDEQREKWNYETTYSVATKYSGEKGKKTESLRENNPDAYNLLKQLGWLHKTRGPVNKRDWKGLRTYLNGSDGKLYADAEKLNFLNELISDSNKDARVLFENRIGQDRYFSEKDYSQVKALWEECKTKASEKTGTTISADAVDLGDSKYNTPKQGIAPPSDKD